MKSPHPQLEFVDLLAEVPDLSEAMRNGKRERARTLDRIRYEEARAESELRLAWADWYEALGLARMNNCQHAAAVDSFQRAMEMVPARELLHAGRWPRFFRCRLEAEKLIDGDPEKLGHLDDEIEVWVLASAFVMADEVSGNVQSLREFILCHSRLLAEMNEALPE